jgi:uracil-DNA glycosylase
MSTEGQLSASWQRHLGAALASAPMRDLSAFLRAEKTKGRVIHPPGPQIFNAFNRTPFEAVRVVILGQDPYHGPGQAHGLSFSVPDGVPPPPSLQNIFKEIRPLAI